jgi:hypothetical protein
MAAIIRWLFVVCWMGVMFMLSSITSLQIPFVPSFGLVLRNLAHIGEYAVLTGLLWWALQMYTSSKVRAWLLAALAAALYGVSDEWHQSWIAGRYGFFRDRCRLCPRAIPALPTHHIHMAMPEMSSHTRVSVTTPGALGAVLTSSLSCAFPL